MPTGYTAAIEKGITFEQYAWSCARAFGALVLMRDDPADAPIPERFEPSTYSATALAQAQSELAELSGITIEEANRRAAIDRQRTIDGAEAQIASGNALRVKYEAMLAQVRAWQPPTPEHVSYKQFMESQIVDSIKFDCSSTWAAEELAKAKATPVDGQAWLEERREKLTKDIGYHAKGHAEEMARTESRNQWVAALRASLGEPVVTR